jgi:hypothetical protein
MNHTTVELKIAWPMGNSPINSFFVASTIAIGRQGGRELYFQIGAKH